MFKSPEIREIAVLGYPTSKSNIYKFKFNRNDISELLNISFPYIYVSNLHKTKYSFFLFFLDFRQESYRPRLLIWLDGCLTLHVACAPPCPGPGSGHGGGAPKHHQPSSMHQASIIKVPTLIPIENPEKPGKASMLRFGGSFDEKFMDKICSKNP